MKTLEQYAGKLRSPKLKTNESDWTRCCSPPTRPFTRSDGSVGVDKTKGLHARPGKKEAIRNANRAQVKRGRQLLKAKMLEDLSEEIEDFIFDNGAKPQPKQSCQTNKFPLPKNSLTTRIPNPNAATLR